MNMLGTLSLLSSLSILATTIATPIKARSEYALKERHHVPRLFSRVQRAPLNHVIDLKIALKQSNFDELERQLYEG